MRRALLTLGGTAAGLAALLSFKTHTLAAADPATSTPPTSAGTAQPLASGSGSGSASPAASKKADASPKASAGSPASARTLTGTVANTQYGPMQVQVTLAGTKISKVTVLQRTDDGSESDEIDANAIPKLTSETLAAQSAHIDAVSGASYTSSGYIQSLQSALDQAGA
ncbi:MAG TPA: FMN-binding protein [Trebonia sp.]